MGSRRDLLNRQNVLSVEKAICWQSLTFVELRTHQDYGAETDAPKFLLDATLHLQRNYGNKREDWPSGLLTIVYGKKWEAQGSL